VPKARRLDKVAFEEMLEMASLGAKVLQVRSVELAMVHKVRTSCARASMNAPQDIDPMARPAPGTLICDEEEIVEQQVVTGIAFSKDEAQISLRASRTSRASPPRSSDRWPKPISMST
jgi:aspartate kinase